MASILGFPLRCRGACRSPHLPTAAPQVRPRCEAQARLALVRPLHPPTSRTPPWRRSLTPVDCWQPVCACCAPPRRTEARLATPCYAGGRSATSARPPARNRAGNGGRLSVDAGAGARVSGGGQRLRGRRSTTARTRRSGSSGYPSSPTWAARSPSRWPGRASPLRARACACACVRMRACACVRACVRAFYFESTALGRLRAADGQGRLRERGAGPPLHLQQPDQGAGPRPRPRPRPTRLHGSMLRDARRRRFWSAGPGLQSGHRF